MLNTAIIMGRICNDLELRKTPSSVSVTKFTVAVDRPYKQGEERKADFINVIAWRGTAEFICRNFNKGKMIAVKGAIQTGSYEKDGRKIPTFEIIADDVFFCGGKNDDLGGNSSQNKPQSKETAYYDNLAVDTDDLDDSLPF